MADGVPPGKSRENVRKKPVNVSIDAELAAAAKAAGFNLSSLLEETLRDRLREVRAAAWKAETRAAIEASNAYFERNGLPLDKFRVR